MTSADTRKVDLGTHALRVREVGSGEPVFVCLGGFLDTVSVWDALAPKLAALGRAVAVEQRAHGHSTAPAGPYRREDLVADLLGVLDALGIRSAVLVGHGLGGMVALGTALAAPERVQRLILLATSTEASERTVDFYKQVVRAGEVNKLEGLAHAVFGPTTTRKLEGDGVGLTEIARMLQGMNADPLTPRLGAIRCPTLVLVGDRDPLHTDASHLLERGVPGARLEVIPEQGHWLHVDAPDAVARAIAGWWVDSPTPPKPSA